MNSNWGLVDPLPDPPRDKKAKRQKLAERAQRDLLDWIEGEGIVGRPLVARAEG